MKKYVISILGMSVLACGMIAGSARAAIQTKLNPTDGAAMVYVPAGAFTMGSNNGTSDEKPVHQVTLDGYWIYKTEVTVAQYERFCAVTKHALPRQITHTDATPGTLPVQVDWQEAADYCKWAGVQLPTEAQWEKAARGTDKRQYPWGNQFDKTKCRSGQSAGPVPVGKFPQGASPYGCLDMAGNVWEWCYDWFGSYPASAVTNPTGPSNGFYNERVARGGEWDSNPRNCRVTARLLAGDGTIHGFRCVLSSIALPSQPATQQPAPAVAQPVQQPVQQTVQPPAQPNPQPAQPAADQPTLQETIDWLQGAIASHGGYAYDFDSIIDDTKVKGSWSVGYSTNCDSDTFTIVETQYSQNKLIIGQSKLVATTVFALKDFDPDKVDVTVGSIRLLPDDTRTDGPDKLYYVGICASYGKQAAKYSHVDTITTPSPDGTTTNTYTYTDQQNINGLSVVFTDKSMADRVAKAFTYAIRLSGGRSGEPF